MSTQDLNFLKEQFISDIKSKGKGIATQKNYRADIEYFIRYISNLPGKGAINTITHQSIKDYGAHIQVQYPKANSYRRRVQALRLFFDFLLARGIIEQNFAISLPSVKKFLDIPRPCPFIDLKILWTHLLEQAKSDDPMYKLLTYRNMCITILIFGGGLKVSDLAALKAGHVYTGNDPRVMIASSKREPYTIPLPSVFSAVCDLYLDLLEEMKKKSAMEFDRFLYYANPHAIISGKLSPRGLEVMFKEYSEKLKIEITPKSLRQAGIFNWLHKKHDDTLIKEWLGVAPSYTLNLYRDHMSDHMYQEECLNELYKHYISG